MNRLNINEGGQPLYLDDLDFMQSAFAEAVRGIMSTYGNVILSGCEVKTSNVEGEVYINYYYNKGYIALNGEVFPVEKGSFSADKGVTLYWKVVRTEEQKEVFENSSEHNVYQYAKVVLTDSVGTNDVYALKNDVKTIEELTSNVRIIDNLYVYTTNNFKNTEIHIDDAETSWYENGDVVELIISMGLESGVMGGYTPSIESFKFMVKDSGINTVSKAIVWRKTNVSEPDEVAFIHVNFNPSTGIFYMSNPNSADLHLSSNDRKVIVYKNRTK